MLVSFNPSLNHQKINRANLDRTSFQGASGLLSDIVEQYSKDDHAATLLKTAVVRGKVIMDDAGRKLTQTIIINSCNKGKHFIATILTDMLNVPVAK